MWRRLVPLAALPAAVAPVAVAQPTGPTLAGTVAMSGRVTVAVHIRGERPGQRVSRTWTFTPLCGAGRVRPRGEAVPFEITVRITAASGSVATTISATYTNRRRINRTRRVALPSHDAAVYTGTRVASMRAPTRRSPAGS